jgi:predicted hydrocarbon binding protein
MAIPEIDYDATYNVARLGGESLVFHCHFYNCALQRAVEDGLGADARAVLRDAASGPVHAQIAAIVGEERGRALDVASKIFAQLGFGRLDLSTVGERGGTVDVAASHYALGWIAAHGERDEPVCRFVEGYIAGAVAAALGRTPDSVRVEETACYACGADVCTFTVEVA